ncbi:MAG: hypothetical protein IPL32_18315 [Chloracidobacterium sp.]|nr:hypothetical protein [Chloracidobacterium sp.]
MARLTQRKMVMFTPEELQWLAQLAEINTSGNESELVRRLLRIAMRNPEKFGLLLPLEDEAEGNGANK